MITLLVKLLWSGTNLFVSGSCQVLVRVGAVAALLTAFLLFTTHANLPNALAQEEILATYVVNIPPTPTEVNNGVVHYDPAEIAIPVGTTVLWFNDDPLQPHTVTSGSPREGPDNLFSSGFMGEGSFLQYTFDEAGEYEYYCQFHPSAVGKVFVSDFFVEGENFRLSYGTGAVFDFTENERTLLVFEPTSVDIPRDEPATYQITILKGGQEMFSKEFQTLGGMLYLELVPTDGDTQVTGPDIRDPVIGTYHVYGSFLKDNSAYTIRAEIVESFDGPTGQPLLDEFGVQIVPEFAFLSVILAVGAGIGATILAGRRRYYSG